MSVTYQQLLHDVAIRLNALVGSQVAALDTTYNTATLTSANFKSADWPFGAFRDAILIAEEDFAWAIADTANHPWRSVLASVTATLANASDIPSTDTGGDSIIGVLGAVYDATDNRPLTEATRAQVLLINRLATGVPEYAYCIDGRRLYHTRTGVVIEVCVYDHTAQLTAFGANSAMLLPDVLEGPITYRAVSILTKETAFADQAAIYATYANDAERRIREGLVSVNSVAVPVEGRAA